MLDAHGPRRAPADPPGYVVRVVELHVPGSSDAVRMIDVRSPAPRKEWRELLALDPLALETQSPEWADAMGASRHYADASRFYEFANGRRVVLPLLRRTVGGRTALEASNPMHCGVGGVVAAGGPQPAEIAAVLTDLNQHPVAVRTFWPHPLTAGAWADAWSRADPPGGLVVARRAHTIDLAGGMNVVSTRFGKATRAGVRHARRSGVAIECGTGGRLVDEFYDLMELATRRWAQMQHEPAWLALRRLHHREPRSKFHAIGRHLGDRMQIWLARVDGRPIATILVLRGSNAYNMRGAMDEEMRTHRANDLLYVTAIEDACAAGCGSYYLGDSGWSDSLAKYKERFGARPCLYTEYRSERLPVTRAEGVVKGAVKRVIGFKDF
jgi:Acetyltransferase (GNAT) domain